MASQYPIWSKLTSLEFLDISYNQLEVPLSFKPVSNHSKLVYFDVSYNTITADTEFQNWIPNFQLQLFAMEGCLNQLQKLPSFLHYQYTLKILAIGGNKLSGSFPNWLLENNTRLEGLYSRHNTFNGPLKLPSSSDLHLVTIDVSVNKLNGHIPANISLTFPKLGSLNMSHNLFTGPIPSDVSGIRLEMMDLSDNLLYGVFPSDVVIGSPTLYYLRLSNNKLKGQILPKDVQPQILLFLYLNDNNFEGPLPPYIFLKSLFVLDVSYNNFIGEISKSIGDNTRMLQLDLSNN